MAQMHLENPEKKGEAVCKQQPGYYTPVTMTDDPKQVTCGRCEYILQLKLRAKSETYQEWRARQWAPLKKENKDGERNEP